MLECERRQYILRISTLEEDFRRDAFAAQFASPDLPIPAVLGIGRYGHGWWCISEQAAGTHLDDLDAGALERVLPSLGAMLRAMRDVTSPETHGYGSWDAAGNGGFASFADHLRSIAVDQPGPRDSGWSDKLAGHTDANGVFLRGVRVLQDLAPVCSTRRQLVHMDTLNRNVNVADSRVSGIYDWGCAMWGDAVYDLAWFAFWEPWYPQWAQVHVADRLIAAIGVEGDHVEERIACCKLHIALAHIRYNAFIGNTAALNEVVIAAKRLIAGEQ